MGIEYEPTEVGLLQNPFQARTISTFRQPKPFWLFIKDIDVLIAADKNLRTRGRRRLLVNQRE